MNNTQIIFFVLVFIVLVGYSEITKKFNISASVNIGISLALTLILLGICSMKKSMMKEPFFFEVTPEKKCRGGAYMRQSDTELQNYCNSLSQQQKSFYNCGKMYNGEPVHFEYTPLSNDYWENDWR